MNRRDFFKNIAAVLVVPLLPKLPEPEELPEVNIPSVWDPNLESPTEYTVTTNTEPGVWHWVTMAAEHEDAVSGYASVAPLASDVTVETDWDWSARPDFSRVVKNLDLA